MPNILISSFNSGELSPLMLNRYGVEKVVSGCRRLENFLLTVHGPAFRRPGMVRQGESISQDETSRLFAFTFSNTTSFILEFSADGLAVWGDSGKVTLLAPVVLPYTSAECFELQILQVNDVCYLVHKDHAPQRLIRYADDDWQLEDVEWVWPPLLDENATDLSLAVNAGTMTASAAIFTAEHVGSYWQIAHRRDDSIVELSGSGSWTDPTLSDEIRIIGSWDLFTYGTWTTTVHLEREDAAGNWEVIRSWVGKEDRNVVANGFESVETNMRIRLEAGTATGDVRFVLEAADAKIYGLVQVDSFTSATEVEVTEVASVHSTDSTLLWTEGAFSTHQGFPRCIGAHGGRVYYGSTGEAPQRLWSSVVNDYDNFRRNSQDDGSMSFVPVSWNGRNEINWLQSQGEALLMGTSSEEWMIHGEGRAITPTNIQVEVQSRNGSAYLPAQMVQEAVVFVQRSGRRVRRIAARSDSDPWTASDLTTLAEHITLGGIVQMAYMANPLSVLWAVTANGELLGMTLENEQNVFGWHRHPTSGAVESIAVRSTEDGDELWLSVLRENERVIERFDLPTLNREFEDREVLNYLDSSVMVTGSDLEEVSGLDHLEGLEVSVLGDASNQGNQTVSGGTVTVDPPASTVIVGLPFDSILQPMRIDLPMNDGTAQHRPMRVHKVGVFLYSSLGGEIADSDEEDAAWEPLLYRSVADPIDAPPPLLTGENEATVESTVRDNINVMIRQREPLPFNVGSLTIKGDVHGE